MYLCILDTKKIPHPKLTFGNDLLKLHSAQRSARSNDSSCTSEHKSCQKIAPCPAWQMVECPQIEAQHEEDQRRYLLPNVFTAIKWLKITSLIPTQNRLLLMGWGGLMASTYMKICAASRAPVSPPDPSCFLLFGPQLQEYHGNIKWSPLGGIPALSPQSSLSLPGGRFRGDQEMLPTCQDWTERAPLDAAAHRWQGTDMMQAQQDMNSSTGRVGQMEEFSSAILFYIPFYLIIRVT